MPNCECIATCIFFRDIMDNMPVMSDIFKKKYCLKDPSHCARYQVFKAQGPSKVPTDMFPSQHERAAALIAETADTSDDEP